MSIEDLWKSPVYQFRIPSGTDADGNQLVKEVVVDVTTSAPSFDAPGKTLRRIFTEVFDHLRFQKSEKTDRVLDFGAGKLRNSVYLLGKKYNVTAVEFEKLSKESVQGQRMLEKAKRSGSRFRELIFPHEFVQSNARFDIVLIVNVLNVMPVPSERLLVLQHCYEKLRKGGYLLWYTQYGDLDQNKRCTNLNVLGDGYYIGGNRKFKSFYREFSAHEIDEMLTSSGFVLEKSFHVSHNQARLYRKEDTNVLKQVLRPDLIKAELNIRRGVAKPEEIEPKIAIRRKKDSLQEPATSGLAIESLYVGKLAKIKAGKKQAMEYQKLVHLIFSRVFEKQFSKIKFEETLYKGRKRIDLIAINSAEKGFFNELSSKHQIKCGFIPIECKNYDCRLGNPEFDQIGGRLSKTLGLFGFLVYREGDESTALSHCQDRLDDDKHIIALNDQDLAALLEFRRTGDEKAVEDYLHDKFIALVGRK